MQTNPLFIILSTLLANFTTPLRRHFSLLEF